MLKIKLTILTVLLCTNLTAVAQSNLPPCSMDAATRWHNCFGTATAQNGTKYVGEFFNGTRHGRGTWTHPSGEKYIGEYTDGYRNGRGTYTYPDGGRYVGHFLRGMYHGEGIRYTKTGVVLESGRWESDVLVKSYILDSAQYSFNQKEDIDALPVGAGFQLTFQLDLKQALVKRLDATTDDLRRQMREANVRHAGISRSGEIIEIRFRDLETRASALKLIRDKQPDLIIGQPAAEAGFLLTLSLTAAGANRTREAALKQNLQALSNRANELGVRDHRIFPQGDDRIAIELPAGRDVSKLRDMLGRSLFLEIRLVCDSQDELASFAAGTVPFGCEQSTERDGRTIIIRRQILLTSDNINGAMSVVEPQSREPTVHFSLDKPGEEIFRNLTRNNVGKRLAIVLRETNMSEVLIAPVIRGEIGGGKVQISGRMQPDEADELALLLRAGPLATPINLVEERPVSRREEHARPSQIPNETASAGRLQPHVTRVTSDADNRRQDLLDSAPRKPHALIIGNAAYPGSSRLDNPVHDANAVSQKLRTMGFTVTVITDVNRQRLVQALAQFRRSASEADLSLFYYSGHGVQISGTNYILPTDVDQSDPAQATIQGVSLNSVVESFMPGRTKLVFLDACRDNPLQRTGDRSVSRGLAPVSAAQGTLISYATKDGQTASDGTGSKNSPFTQALLEHLSDPVDIAVVLRKVREKVMKATGGKQQPWEYGSLTGGELILSAIKR